MIVNEIGMICGLCGMFVGLIFFAVGTFSAMIQENHKDV